MPVSTQNVKLQNLRDFTVQIRRLSDNAIVGTGVAISMDGEIITCAHVVRAAGVEPREHKDAEIVVYFPQLSGGQKKERRAKVKTCFPDHDDDIVLLQLIDGSVPLGPEQIAVLGSAEGSEGNPFRSYGYAPIGNRLSRYVDGEIMGPVEIVLPPESVIQADPVELRTRDIRPGISGGAVLDEKRNLIVGLVTEWWNPKDSPLNDNLGWATDARVLAFQPINWSLSFEYARQSAPQPKVDIIEAGRQVAPKTGGSVNRAPPLVKEWVGREELLNALTMDWADPKKLVTGLIGFGGEGKSSLARKWIEVLYRKSREEGSQVKRMDNVFWWSFYEKPNSDEFFETALVELSGGRIDPRNHPSSSGKANYLAGMIAGSDLRHLFILDGLEVMQHQEGDSYGLFRSNDLRQFLEFFAAPGHNSFCLVTSRAPLLDLLSYTTYTHRDVTRLSDADGRALLRELGVKGRTEELDKVVRDWDGHALTLSLVGSYLSQVCGGDVANASEFNLDSEETVTSVELSLFQKYNHVQRVLSRYDKHLSYAERAFLLLFSAFRIPVKPDAIVKVFRTNPIENQQSKKSVISPLLTDISSFSDESFKHLIQNLLAFKLIRFSETEEHYSTHPLVRNYYFEQLTKDPKSDSTHNIIKDYYLSQADDTSYYRTLEELTPLIEVVHHACQAGAMDEAWELFYSRLYYGRSKILIFEIGASKTALDLLHEILLEDTKHNSNLKIPDRMKIMNEIGMRNADQGNLKDALKYLGESLDLAENISDHRQLSSLYQDYSEIYVYLGDLVKSKEAAERAVNFAEQIKSDKARRYSLAKLAWVMHLTGNLNKATNIYKQVEKLDKKITGRAYPYSLRGIQFAEHLRRTNHIRKSTSVTRENLEITSQNNWKRNISQCNRLIGDLKAGEGYYALAIEHFEHALKIARSIQRQEALIEVLLARGLFFAKYNKNLSELGSPKDFLAQSFSELTEAMGYATLSGYRLFEADIRIALAWAYKASGDPARARLEATHARQMSEEMGYYWGKVDADEVLKAIEPTIEKT